MAPLTVFDPIRWWGRVAPERIALVDRHRALRVSYAELDLLADRWAALLDAEGVAAGARVAVLSANRCELVALLFACARRGVALVPLNWRLAEPELMAVLADADPMLVVSEPRFGHLAVGLPSACWILFDEATATRVAALEPTTPREVDAESTAMILYTSGSTGRPKGAMLSHRQLHFNAIATSIAWGLTAEDIGPITTPFFHTGGWNVFAAPLWLQGGRVVLFEQFEPSTFLGALHEEQCTIAFGVPTQFVMLTEVGDWGRPLPRLRWMISGGAPCPLALAARIRESGYRLREGFGMTEFGPNCFAISDAAALAKPGVVGWPVPFAQIRLVDEQDTVLGAGVVGELQLRGPQLFSGYLRDETRTAEVMTADGWLRTGDLAIRDEDGAYAIRGRRKQMFISGGENVYPGEVEAALADCVGVAEAVVIGVPHERWGEVGHAFVLPRTGAIIAEAVLLAELRVRLAAYKVPKRIEIVTELPRTGAGKVDRRLLESRVRQEAAR